MKKIINLAKAKLLFYVIVMAVVSTSLTAAIVDLGDASSFGILANTAITNNGNSSIDGDIGISPNGASSITGFPPGFYTGNLHAADAVAMQAQSDAATAYNGLQGLTMTQDLSGQDLGGLTLTSGVYSFSSSAQLTGGLTLDAQNDPDAYFVFQTGSTLTTGTDSLIAMVNATAGFSNVFWQVGSSATLGSDTDFVGTIIANDSVSLAGGSVFGRIIALNGAVTISEQSTIIVPEPATLAMLVFGAGFAARKLKKSR